MTKRFNFQMACTAMLLDLGARPGESDQDRMTLQTTGGAMQCKAYEDWLHCQFDDEIRAATVVRCGTFNAHTGKWNWHFNSPGADDVEFLRITLSQIAFDLDAELESVWPEELAMEL